MNGSPKPAFQYQLAEDYCLGHSNQDILKKGSKNRPHCKETIDKVKDKMLLNQSVVFFLWDFGRMNRLGFAWTCRDG
jgi:hypothetical protein